jgi:predicted phage terminase large subunit-like protein
MAWRGYWEQSWFAQRFFPHHCRDPFSRMHTELFSLWSDQTRRGRKTVIAAPRGHAKTTIMLVIQTLHAICYGYEPFIVIVAQSQAEAESRVEQILDELRTNEHLIEVFGELAPPKGQGSKKGFTTRNGVKVKAISRGQSIRGLNNRGNRPSLIILDDVETLEGVQNPDQRQKTLDWFQKDVLPAGQTDGSTNVIIIGTCLHDDSLISYLLNRPDWTARKYQAIEAWSPREDLWDEWQATYTDLSNPGRLEAAGSFFESNRQAMLAETQVLWPEVEPYLKLMKQLVGDGRRAFYSEKQNEPFDPSQQLFNMEAAHYFDWQPSNQTIRCLNRNRNITLPELHTIVAFHDPCLGESDMGDFAAIVVAGKDRHGYMYVLDAFVERCKPEQQIEAAVRLYERWQFDMLILEGNSFQRLLLDSYNRRFSQFEDPPRLLKATQTGDKELRIASLQPYVDNGTLIFNRDLDRKLIEQMRYFPSATHDDGPDSLEGAVNMLLTRRGDPREGRRNPVRKSTPRSRQLR